VDAWYSLQEDNIYEVFSAPGLNLTGGPHKLIKKDISESSDGYRRMRTSASPPHAEQS
jgi:hypothetical protein